MKNKNKYLNLMEEVARDPREAVSLARKGFWEAFGGKRNYLAARRKIEAKTLGKADYVFLMSHFGRGGSEKVAMNYMRTLRKIDGRMKVALIITDARGNGGLDGLPRFVEVVDVGAMATRLGGKWRAKLLGDVVDAMKPRYIQVVNSGAGYDFIAEEGERLTREGTRIFANLFNSDISPSGRKWNFYMEHVPRALPYLTKIFTDNEAIIDEAAREGGLPREKFAVHYQSYGGEITPARKGFDGKLKILWASRITLQKRPDVLVEIARRLDAKKFAIDVYGSFDSGYSERIFDSIPCLEYKGGFADFSKIATGHEVFLYTAQSDGLPNVLLEATGAGLLTLAPDEGGVGEFITEKTGFLEDSPTDVEGYVRDLERIWADFGKYAGRVEAAQELLGERHSERKFVSAVKSDIIEGKEGLDEIKR
jgi:glycosyltransferase involved in cell wall biosynthesis